MRIWVRSTISYVSSCVLIKRLCGCYLLLMLLLGEHAAEEQTLTLAVWLRQVG